MDKKIQVINSTLLPSHYTPATEPFYQGKGYHNVVELEYICKQYKELVHQLRIREQSLLKLFNAELV